jgi:hypothetical protein
MTSETQNKDVNQMVTIQNSKYKVDTLDMGRGAFQALCDSKGVEVVRSGTTFAVGAFFPVLSLSHMIDRGRYNQPMIANCDLGTIFADYQSSIKRRQGGSKVKLILPSVEASQIVSIDRAVGLGGGSHEVGHIICDLAGNDLSPQTAQKIIPVFKEFAEKKYNLFKVLGRWSNVCADIRLEKMMSKLYPESEVRFHSIQEWIWNDLEKQARLSGDLGKNQANCIALMIRDLGKDHKSKSQQRVFNEYATIYPKLWECALSVKHLWQQLQVSIKEYTTFKKKTDMEKEIEKSVHLPLTIAMQILMSLQLPKENKKDQPQDQDQKDQPQDQDSDDQDNQDSNDQNDQDQDNQNDQDQDQDNGQDQDNDQDSDDQDQDDQDSGDQDQDDQDSGDNGQDSEDEQDQDDQDQDSQDQDSGDDQDDQDQKDDQDNGQDQDKEDNGQDQKDQDSDKPSDDGINDDQSDDDVLSQDDQDQDSDDDQDSGDHRQNTPSSQSSFDENTELNLEERIDPNDISKAFQKEFEKLSKSLQYRPYISNGLKIIDIIE